MTVPSPGGVPVVGADELAGAPPADAPGPAHVLAVCTGNLCRSPFLELLLRNELDRRRPATSPGVRVSSGGTGALVGAAMDRRAADQARARGATPARSGREA